MAKKIRVSDFYSAKNEEDGIWFEPKVRGFGTGIEFLVFGPNSDKAVIAREDFAKQLDAAKDIEDNVERKKQVEKATAEFMAKICGDVRGKDGAELLNDDDTPMTKDNILDFFLNSPVIVDEISIFFKGKESFLSAKKKN